MSFTRAATALRQPDLPFAIGIWTVFLGLELRVKFGPMQLHYVWSAISLPSATTKPAGTQL